MATRLKRDITKRMEYVERIHGGKEIGEIMNDMREKHKDKRNHERMLSIAAELGVSKGTIYVWHKLYPDGH